MVQTNSLEKNDGGHFEIRLYWALTALKQQAHHLHRLWLKPSTSTSTAVPTKI